MDSTLSVSKGCFVFKNGATRADKTTKKQSKRSKGQDVKKYSLLQKETTEQLYYQAYQETCKHFMEEIDGLQRCSYSKTLEDLVEYVASNSSSTLLQEFGVEEILPTAALMTGINQPDHLEQFATLSQRIYEKTSACVCLLQSHDCPTVKSTIESMVYSFIEEPYEDDLNREHKRLRRSQCTMQQLMQWYTNNFGHATLKKEDEQETSDNNNILVVILPDFECFNGHVLQDFILILSSYCGRLPFVLIIGVATSVSAVHKTLPCHVMSKIKLKIFQTQAAPVRLNEILDEVILSPKFNFHLSGKTLKFLTHIFLYYDFSINGFIQSFKYCLMEHFLQGNAYALCSTYSTSLVAIRYMKHDDLETIRRLLSFRPYVEKMTSGESIISILTDDQYFKEQLPQLLQACHVYFALFRIFLEFLTVIVADLPKCLLGNKRRELYSFCLSKDITGESEFKECWQMLSFLSKDDFVAKFNKAIKTTKDFINSKAIQSHELLKVFLPIAEEKLSKIDELLEKVVGAGLDGHQQKYENQASSSSNAAEELKNLNRHDLKAKLLQMSKKPKPISDFKQSVKNTLDYILEEIIRKHLGPLSAAPTLYELFVFSDITKVRRNIIGAPRAALHMALNNPHFYLQCKCCALSEQTQMLDTMPDLSVAYKLHLECGRMINLFDWLQAFRLIVDSADNSQEEEQVDPQIQARFTRAVAELQFLGYIKMSKRKTDHATRLTW